MNKHLTALCRPCRRLTFVYKSCEATRKKLAGRMLHKAWLWKRKSSEKTLLAKEKSELLKEKVLELGRSLEELNEQLSSVRLDSRAKGDHLAKQEKVSEAAIAGWEKAKAEVLSFKQQLDNALLHKEVADKRAVQLEAAIKECMQQLRKMKEDQQLIIKTAAMKISREQEKIHMLEEMLSEANKKLSELAVENSNLSQIVVLQEQLIKDLGDSKFMLDANYMEVITKLDSAEKNNSSLSYEVCMLRKELEIHNQEKEFNLKSADAAHRQQLESVRKIAKLESECQRLRVMIRRRLPGPVALAKMRNEVKMLGNSTHEAQKKKSNTSKASMSGDSPIEDCYDALRKNASRTERLHAIESENRKLKYLLTKKSNEQQATHVIFACTESKLSQVEEQLEKFSKGCSCDELTRMSPVSCEIALASISESGGDKDNFNCSESWASALISELEHFRRDKSSAPSCRSTIMPDLSLMDDFIEMEKLVIVSPDKGFEKSIKSCHSYEEGICEPTLLESVNKKLLQIESLTDLKEANQIGNTSFENYPNWLQDIIEVIIEKHHMVQRSFGSILDEVRIALTDMKYPVASKHLPGNNHTSKKLDEAPDTYSRLFDGSPISYMPNSKSNSMALAPNLEKHILKLIELVEGIIQRALYCKNDQHLLSGDDGAFPLYNKNDQHFLSEYVTRTFLWKYSELFAVLQNFLVICSELLHGKSDLEKFTAEVASCLDWIISHCFILWDVSDMKESIKKHLDADELQDDHEHETIVNTSKEMENIDAYEEPNTAGQRSSNGCLLKKLKNVMGQEKKHFIPNHDIFSASQKLAPCQKTILNLGRQFKGLASPRDALLFDKVISSQAPKLNHRPQLHYQMRAHGDVKTDDIKFCRNKGDISVNLHLHHLHFLRIRMQVCFAGGNSSRMDDFSGNSLQAIIWQSAMKSPGKSDNLDCSDKSEGGSDGGIRVRVRTQEAERSQYA